MATHFRPAALQVGRLGFARFGIGHWAWAKARACGAGWKGWKGGGGVAIAGVMIVAVRVAVVEFSSEFRTATHGRGDTLEACRSWSSRMRQLEPSSYEKLDVPAPRMLVRWGPRG